MILFIRIVAISLFLLEANTSIQAQNWYLNLKGGVSWPAMADELGSSSAAVGLSDLLIDQDGSYTDKVLHGTFGGGYNFQLAGGYFFNEHIGVELGVMYYSARDVLEARLDITDPEGSRYLAEDYTYSQQLRVLPAMVVQTNGKINVFARVGLVLPLTGTRITEVTIDDQTGRIYSLAQGNGLVPFPSWSSTADVKIETKGQFSLGFLGAIGLEYPLTNSGLSLFAEAEFQGLTIKASETEYTKYDAVTRNSVLGIEVVSTVDDRTYSQNNINWVDELTQDSNTPGNENFDPNRAEDRLATKVNYSGIGLNLGLRYTFGK